MNKDLEKIVNYILNINNIPLAALKRTPRRKVYLFGKQMPSDVDMSEYSISILVMSQDGMFRDLMNIYHNFEDHKETELEITVNKTLEISELPFFAEKEVHKFKLSIENKQLIIEDEQKNIAKL